MKNGEEKVEEKSEEVKKIQIFGIHVSDEQRTGET